MKKIYVNRPAMVGRMLSLKKIVLIAVLFFSVKTGYAQPIGPCNLSNAPAVCAGSSEGLTLTTPDAGGTWSSTNTAVGSVSAAGVLTGVSFGTATISFTYSSDVCSGATVSIEVTVNPLPGVINANVPVCVGSSITLTDTATGGTWTSSAPSVATIGNTSGTVLALTGPGTTIIKFTKTATGCSRSAVVTVNPLPTSILGTKSVCESATTQLTDATVAGTWSGSDDGTATVSTTGLVSGVSQGTMTVTYELATGCKTTAEVTVNATPAAITGLGSVCTFNSISLAEGLAGGTWSSSNTAVATVPAGGGATKNVSGIMAGTSDISYIMPAGCFAVKTITVVGPDAITGPTAICSNEAGMSMTNTAAGGAWSSSDPAVVAISSAGLLTPDAGLTAATTVTISYTLSGCVVTKPLTVGALPQTIGGPATICPLATTTLTEAVSGGIWSSSNDAFGTVSTGGVLTALNGGGGGNPFPLTIYYTSPGCPAQPFFISVLPFPTVTVSGAGTDNFLCNGSTQPSISFTDENAVATDFTWTNSKPSIGLSSAGTGDIASFTATNNGSADTTAVITVVPSSAECTGSAKAFNITVHPTPTVTTVNYTFCNESSSLINFTGSSDAAITTYDWTNDNPGIGTPNLSSGTGDYSFSTTNFSNTDAVAVFTVTPFITDCPGTAQVFTVTVHPTPMVHGFEMSPACNGSSLTLDFSGSTSPAASYSWNVSNAAYGLAAGHSLSDTSITITETNLTSATVAETVTVTPTIGTCSGSPTSFSFTIHPTPTIIGVSSTKYCNGDNVDVISFTTAVSEVSTTYSWTTDNQLIFPSGSASSYAAGTTNYFPFFVATNGGATDLASILTIVATSGDGCTYTLNDTMTVHPTPSVNVISDVAYNVGEITTAIPFTGVADTFKWANDNTGIGAVAIAVSGTNTVPSFTAAAIGGVSTFTVTPVSGQCVGAATNFKITINAFEAIVAYPAVCNGLTDSILLSGGVPGTTFSWAYSGPHISADTNGTGAQIGPFTAVNTSDSSIVASYTVTPSSGNPFYFTVTVNPTPELTSVPPAAICSGDLLHYVPNVSTKTGAITYAWSRASLSGILPGTSSGSNGIDEHLTNTSDNVSGVIYSYVLTTIHGCTNTQNVTVTVNPTPRLNDTLVSNSYHVCNNTFFNFPNGISMSPTEGFSSMTWQRNATAGISGVNAGADTVLDSLHNSLTSYVPVHYIITLWANGCSSTDSITNVVFPTPVIASNLSLSPNAICSRDTFNYAAASSTTGVTLTWHRATVAGISTAAANGAGNPHEELINGTDSVSLAVAYVYTLTINADNSCFNTQTVIDTVRPTPKLRDISGQVVCSKYTIDRTVNSTVVDNPTTYAWSRTSIAPITPTLASGNNNNINEALSSHESLTPIAVVYTYSLTSSGCSNMQQISVTVNPTPQAPHITNIDSGICSGQMYMHFGVDAPVASSINYAWHTSPAVVEAYKQNYCIVHFPAGVSTYTLTVAANVEGYGCIDSNNYSSTINANVSDDSSKLFVYLYNNVFVCLNNKQTGSVESYQWGYDVNATLQPIFIDGEVNQSYISAGAPDTVNKHYWVMTKSSNGCYQRTYYYSDNNSKYRQGITGADVSMKAYPNPAKAQLTVELSMDKVEGSSLEIFDVLGKKVRSVTVDNKVTEMDLSDLPDGHFIILCVQNGIKVASTQFIKN